MRGNTDARPKRELPGRQLRNAVPGATRAFFLILAAALAACQPRSPAVEVISLNQGWTFTGSDTFTSGFSATVPGTIHTDLLDNGLIPDPFWRDNELVLQWIGEEDWTYRTTFQAPTELVENEALELVFHGLDTFAEVRLNGAPILKTDNMFRRWRVDVTGQVQAGENTLEVHLASPLPPALEARGALPYELPAGNDRGEPPSRVFVRKAAYHYGWDWGPRFVTSGIWRDVELVGWTGARIRDLHLLTDSLTPERAFLTAEVEVEVSLLEAESRAAGGGVPARLTLSSPRGAFSPVEEEVPLEPGMNRFSLPLEIPDPRLWWPNGLGEAHLYTVGAALEAGRRADSARARIGLRTLELVTEPDSIGESFFFRVNGRPVFMKGANVIPLDHFTPRVTEDDYRNLFEDVVRANMNMLRVWGGGIYEGDLFYDLADEHGVLIWQDFMFANGMYPGDAPFLENIRAEATQQVRRLRNHPSLALWCGNNEMDEGWHRWGWARAYETPEDSAAVWNAYEAIFHDILPDVVAAEDPARRYWPSSPSLGWGDPESLNRGDSHYWGVWHGREPFRVLTEKLPRFSSEFGFQAFPPMATVEAFTEPSDRGLYHPIMLVHQKHPIGNELISEYMERDYPVPSRFDDFVYVSQLLQARGMRTAFEAQRRAMPRTMGTLYWQLNDTWPAVSWSSRDYFGRWKALHYAAGESFAPLLLSPVLRDGTVEVWGVSDLADPAEGTLRMELLTFDGTVLWQAPVPTTLPANGSALLWSMPAAEVLGDADPGRTVFVTGLQQEEGVGASGTPGPRARRALLYFLRPKELKLEAPAIRIQAEANPQGVLLTLTSDRLARDVYLTLEGVRFPRNFFDLLPGRPLSLLLSTDLEPGRVEEELRVRTLAEIPGEGMEAGGRERDDGS